MLTTSPYHRVLDLVFHETSKLEFLHDFGRDYRPVAGDGRVITESSRVKQELRSKWGDELLDQLHAQ